MPFRDNSLNGEGFKIICGECHQEILKLRGDRDICQACWQPIEAVEENMKLRYKVILEQQKRNCKINDFLSYARVTRITRITSTARIVSGSSPPMPRKGTSTDNRANIDSESVLVPYLQEHRGKLMCRKCYDETETEICAACHRPIDGRILKAMGKVFFSEKLPFVNNQALSCIHWNRHCSNVKLKPKHFHSEL